MNDFASVLRFALNVSRWTLLKNVLTLRRRLSDFEQEVLSRFVKTPLHLSDETLFRKSFLNTFASLSKQSTGELSKLLSMYLNYHFMNFFRNQNAVLLDFVRWMFWGLSKLNHLFPMDHSWVISLLNVSWASSRKFFQTLFKTAFWVPFLGGVRKVLYLCRTERCWDILSWTLSEVWAKNFRQCCQNCFLRVQFITMGTFLSESERNAFVPWSANVRIVIRTQLFLCDGSFLGYNFFEHFAGSKQKTFREVCQNCFLSDFIGRVTKTPCF